MDGCISPVKQVCDQVRQHELLAQTMCGRISLGLQNDYMPRLSAQEDVLNGGAVIDGLGVTMRNWEAELLGEFRSRRLSWVDELILITFAQGFMMKELTDMLKKSTQGNARNWSSGIAVKLLLYLYVNCGIFTPPCSPPLAPL